MPPPPPPDRLTDLTGARFFAALGVVIFHFAPLSALLFTAEAYKWVPYGKTGVSFFFTLSGFVLAYTYLDWFKAGVGRQDFRRFVQNRVARIMPAHAVVMLLLIPLVAIQRLGSAWPSAFIDNPEATWTLVWTWLVSLLLVQIYTPSFAAVSWWNVPAWSIDCEAFFYAAFPFLAWGIGRWLTTPGRLLVAGLVAYGIEFGGLWAAVQWLHTYGPPWHWDKAFTLDFHSHLPDLRIWEFVIGCLAGTYVRRRQQAAKPGWLGRRGVREVVLTLSLAAVVGIMALPGPTDADRLSKLTLGWYVLFTPAFTLIILALASGRTWLSGLLSHPWTVRMGEASYGLYLIHWSVLIIDNLLQRAGLEAWRLGFTGSVAVSLVLSLVLYRWVEAPARRWLRAPRPEAQTKPSP